MLNYSGIPVKAGRLKESGWLILSSRNGKEHINDLPSENSVELNSFTES